MGAFGRQRFKRADGHYNSEIIMIKISPMPEHFPEAQPNADYCCTIKADISLAVEKKVSINITISGGSSIAIWRQSVGGKRETIRVAMGSHQLAALERINSLPVNEWLLRTQGRRFEVILSLERAIMRRGSDLADVVLDVIFVRELI